MGSNAGTLINEEEIKQNEKVPLVIGSHIRIGETILQFEVFPPRRSNQTVGVEPAADRRDFRPVNDPNITQRTDFIKRVNISEVLPATDPLVFKAAPGSTTTSSRHQRLLYELLLQFGTEAPLDQLLQTAVEQLVAVMPAADRGALLIKKPGTAQLLLKAHLPPGQPAVSSTLAEHAMNCRGGFIWRRNPNLSASQIEHQMASGMYAPLLWKGETIGVVCIDNCGREQSFSSDDLELLVAAAQHIALTLANHTLREDLRCNAELVERLLTNFSPAIRRQLLERARHGRLRLGGEKSEVTILSSDIRGFTLATAAMEADEVVDMLNSYFSALVQAIFRHDGTIDKFVGDGILAVFGSPEPDDNQHSNAIRAAIAMQAALTEVNESRRTRGQPICEMGIGVHCGTVLHGFIGSEERMEFTVIGDAVNRTARFCDSAQAGEILISPEVHQRVWRMVRTTPTTIQTKHEGHRPAFRVISCNDKPGSVDIRSLAGQHK